MGRHLLLLQLVCVTLILTALHRLIKKVLIQPASRWTSLVEQRGLCGVKTLVTTDLTMLIAIGRALVYLPDLVVAAILHRALNFHRVWLAAGIVFHDAASAGPASTTQVRRVLCGVELGLLLQVHIYRVLVLTQAAYLTVFAVSLNGRWRCSFRTTGPDIHLKRMYCLYVYLGCPPLLHSLCPSHGRQNFWLMVCTALCWNAVGLLGCVSYYERSGFLLWRSLLGRSFIGGRCSILIRLRGDEAVWLA